MNKVITFLTLMSLIFLLSSCGTEIHETTNYLNQIKKEIIKVAKNKNIPSIEVSINTENDALNFSYNHPDVEQQEVYGIGSTTKFLSSVLIFKLVEDGQLELNDSITKYIDSIDYIENIKNITIRDLLNHKSGLSDYSQHSTWIQSVINGNPPKTFDQKLLLIDLSLTNSGTFSYSNTNYLFLEKVVESITNKPFNIAFNDFYNNIGLAKIKMGNSNPNLQAFFAQTIESNQSSSTWKEYHGFAGSAYSEPKELNRFLHSLFISKSILKDSTIIQMKEWINMLPKAVPIGVGNIGEYGNGIMKLKYNGKEYIGHAGGTLKYQSFLFFNEEEKTSISVTANCSGRYYNNTFFQELIPKILDRL